jgi:histone H3/H4
MAKTNFLRFNSVKSYVNDVKNMRISDAAIREIVQRVDSLVIDVISEAQTLSQENKRKTIMGPDVAAALEKYLGKRHLGWEELAEEIIRQDPTELGQISKAISAYIQKHKKS